MFWIVLLACGSQPDGLAIGPLALPAAEHASRVPSATYAAFATPNSAPTERELERCKAGEAVPHDVAVIEVREDGVRIAGRLVPEDLVGDALLTLSDTTRAVADAGCRPGEPGRLLVAADARAPYARVMGLMYVAGKAGFTAFDVLVDDAAPEPPQPVVAGPSETLVLRAGSWSLSGGDVAPEALATRLAGPVDLVMAAGEDVPWGDAVRAHDVVAGLGGRVMYGLGDDVQAAPWAPGAHESAERHLTGDLAVLPIYVPTTSDALLAPLGAGPP